MNEQQLQQILTIQQAIAAAATAAMINTLLNPQQAAANLVNQNALTESPTTPNTDYREQDTPDNNQTTPTAPTDNNHHHNQLHRHQNQHHQRQDNQVAASLAAVSAAATGSNMMIQQAASQSPNNHSNKKLKRHNQAPQSFSRQHNSPSSSSAFLPNNVGLPRKLVRGQDVWLGRGAEQTRQILKCMWCNQSFRTLAEMTQHMKITQHYTNIISQEQITSWKQPEGSEGSIPSGRQQSKQSISSKNLDDFHEATSASEKSIDSEREDSFSNDEAPTPPPPPPPPSQPSKRQHRAKSRPERTISSSNNNNNSELRDNKSPILNNNTSLAAAINNDSNSNNDKTTEQQATDLDLDDDSDSNDENKCKRESASREESRDNEDDCDKKATKKRPREDDSDVEANSEQTNTDLSVKQEPNGGKEGGLGGTGDPLSALETMVEKSFDPRMGPGMASGGILQRLGIDEEVCPPWQHINYANWYAAAAYGHPMAAALLAAGINLQNGIKLSKNMGSKKNDD